MPTKPNSIQPLGCASFFIIGVLILWIIKCNSDNSNTIKNIAKIDTVLNNTPAHNSLPSSEKYEIISKGLDNQGYVNQLMVYIKDKHFIKTVNKQLVGYYKTGNNVTLQIFYFDNKKIALNYRNALDNPGISDASVNRMSRHVIGKYEWIDADNTENFYIGPRADDH